MNTYLRSVLAVALVLTGAYASVHVALATHSWGGYHWARTTPSFTLRLGDNLAASWKPYLATSIADWSTSSVLDLTSTPGTKGKTCKPTAGRVEICNSNYGRNGWLGIASVWANGNHITQGTVKLNDTYFGTAQYNTPAWKNLVMCQEVGHTFGLDHQDEDFANANLGTCMDYTNDPSSNQHPNQHDYDMLAEIYAHLDTTTSVSASRASSNMNSDDPKEWGREIRRSKDGRSSLHERHLGNGERIFTFVVWADK